MEKDLEYNSENNRSSLSSIHREIQEANEQELSLKQSEKESMETGGCQPKDLQDDTVMNKCNNMLMKSPPILATNESFTKQILMERKAGLNHELAQISQAFDV